MLPATNSKVLLRNARVKQDFSHTVTEISYDVFENMESASYPVRLDFSPSVFKLTSIDGVTLVNPSAVKELDFTRNELEELNLDVIYTALRILRAPFNKIQTISVVCRRLSEIHLNNNKLAEFPDFSQIPLVEVVNLAFNEITGSFNSVLLGERKIKTLRLQGNTFSAQTRSILHREISFLKQLPNLRTLDIGQTAMTTKHRDYRPLTIAICPKLEMLDDIAVDRDEVAAAMEDLRNHAGHFMDKDEDEEDEDEDEGQTKSKRRKIFGLTLAAVAEMEKVNIPGIVDECIAVLERNNEAKMFEVDPTQAELDQLRREFERNTHAGGELAQTLPPEVPARLLIDFFESLIEKPIPKWSQKKLLQACRKKNSHAKIKKVMGKIPPPNMESVIRVCTFLDFFTGKPLVNKKLLVQQWAQLLLGESKEIGSREMMEVLSRLMTYSTAVTNMSDSEFSGSDESGPKSKLQRHDSRFSSINSENPRDAVSVNASSASASGSYTGSSHTGTSRSSHTGTSRSSGSHRSGESSESGSMLSGLSESQTGSDVSRSEGNTMSRTAGSGSYSESHTESGSGTLSSVSVSETSASSFSEAPPPKLLGPSVSRMSKMSKATKGTQPSDRRGSISKAVSRSSLRSRSSHASSGSSGPSAAKPLLLRKYSQEVIMEKKKKHNNVGLVVRNKKTTEGVKVVKMIGGSPAERCQVIDVHDRLLKVGTHDVSTIDARDVTEILCSFIPGMEIEITVEREIVRGGEKEVESVVIRTAKYIEDIEMTVDAADAPDFSSGYETSSSDQAGSSDEEQTLKVDSDHDSLSDVSTPPSSEVDARSETSGSMMEMDGAVKLYDQVSLAPTLENTPSLDGIAKPTRTEASIEIAGLTELAPKAAQWMARMDGWVGTLEKCSTNVQVKTDLLEAWKLRVNHLKYIMQHRAPGKRKARERKLKSAITKQLANNPKVARNEQRSTFPFSWDQESDSEDGVGNSHHAEVELEAGLGGLLAKLQSMYARVEGVKAENNRIKELLLARGVDETVGPEWDKKLADLDTQLARMTGYVDEANAESKAEKKECKKLGLMMERDKKILSKMSQEIDLLRSMQAVAVDAGMGEKEQAVRYQIARETAVEELDRANATILGFEDLMTRSKSETDALEAQNARLEAQLAQLTQTYTSLTDEFEGDKTQANRLRTELEESGSGNQYAMVELREKTEQVATLTNRVARLEHALSIYLDE